MFYSTYKNGMSVTMIGVTIGKIFLSNSKTTQKTTIIQ